MDGSGERKETMAGGLNLDGHRERDRDIYIYIHIYIYIYIYVKKLIYRLYLKIIKFHICVLPDSSKFAG